MKYELIIFDWDGTLMDSAQKIVSCMQGAAKQANLPIPEDSEVKHIIGISLIPAIQQLFNVSEVLADKVAQLYKQNFVVLDQTPCQLFTGSRQVLQHLHSKPVKLAVATGKARIGLERVWQQSQTKEFFATSRCGDEAQSKPHPDMLQQILHELNISAKNALMVGDTTHDLGMADALGMDCIGVSYGAHDADKLLQHKPIAIIDTPSDLLNYC